METEAYSYVEKTVHENKKFIIWLGNKAELNDKLNYQIL